MQKKFIKNLGLLLFLNLLIKPFWVLGIGVTVQKAVGPVEYGIYFAMLNFSFLFQIVLDFGINNYHNRAVSQDFALARKKLLSLAMIKLLLALVFIFTVLVVGKYIMQYPDYYLFLLFLVGINQVLMSGLLFLRANLAGMQLFKHDSIISVLDRTLMIIVCGALLWGNITDEPFKIAWFAYAQTFSYIVTIGVALGVILKHSKLEWEKNFIAGIFPALRMTIPYAILTLIMTLYYRIDAVMIEYILPDGALQAGVYAQSYKLLETAGMFAFLFATLLFPMFSKMIAARESVVHLMDLAFRLLVAPAILLAAIVYFYSFELMSFLYLEKVAESARTLTILMLTFVPLAATYVFGTLLTANGDLKTLNIISLFGLAVNVGLNMVLIPEIGIFGAAIATLITQIVIVGIQIMVVKKVFSLRPDYRLILTTVIFSGGVVAMGLALEYLETNWVWAITIMVIAGALWAFLTRIINLKNIYEIIRFG